MTNVVELTAAKYSAFIDFDSDTCPPCQTLLTYLPNLAEHYKEEKVISHPFFYLHVFYLSD